MPYFRVAEIKNDLVIPGTTEDDNISKNWGPKADLDTDNLLYETAEKARRLTELPVLPLKGKAINATIISVSNHFVKRRYYQKIKQKDLADEEEKMAQVEILQYIKRLNVDAVYYGRIIR